MPSARFMGGRAFQLLAPQGLVPVSEGERRRVLDEAIAYLPSLPSGSGPYPDREGRFTVDEAGLTPGERLLAVSWYLALMSATCLDLIGADGDTIVEGPFAANGAYLDMLTVATGRPSRVEDIGRPRVEPSFVPTIDDRMICVPDAASLAAMRHLERVAGRRAGGSTGTNLWGAFRLVAEMLAAGRGGSVVTLLCDGGERYAHTYYSDEWLAAEGLDLAPYSATLQEFTATGRWREPA